MVTKMPKMKPIVITFLYLFGKDKELKIAIMNLNASVTLVTQQVRSGSKPCPEMG